VKCPFLLGDIDDRISTANSGIMRGKMSKLKSIVNLLIILLSITQLSYAASLHLEWDANNEADLAGYKVYYGTSSGNYGEPDDAGNVTEHELSGLTEGETYYVAITAYDNSDNESQKSDEESGVAQSPPDTQDPTITITSPTSSSTYTTSNSTINISGTASDNVGVTEVIWANDRGGSGSASGTTNWSVSNISLQSGQNIITVTAKDAADNLSTDTLTVTYTPPDTQDPTINITSPTSSPTYTTSNSTINISGTASDNVGVTEVTWENNRGGSGTASGTTYWSVTSISLQIGENIITFTAHDAAGNTGADIITVNYTPPTTSTTSSSTSSTTTSVVSTTTTTVPTTTSTSSVSTTVSTTTTVLTTTSSTPVTTTKPATTTTLPSNTTSVVTTSTTTTLSDNTPPTGSITINKGDEVTQSQNVELNLFATDDGKDLALENALMTFSNDNEAWSDLEPYKTTKIWRLSPGEGEKTVYAIFRDASGNWMSKPVNDKITYEEEKTSDDPYKLQPASITASSELLPFWTKESVMDGDPLTTWSTLPSFFWKNEFITLDLGEIKKISDFDMYASRMFGIDYFPANFKIETSRDNADWKEMTTENSYNIKAAYTDSWDFNASEARYIRVSITKAKFFFIFFYIVQIAEIEVYGWDMPEKPPLLLEEKYLIKDETDKDNEEKETEKADILNHEIPGVPGKPVVTFK